MVWLHGSHPSLVRAFLASARSIDDGKPATVHPETCVVSVRSRVLGGAGARLPAPDASALTTAQGRPGSTPAHGQPPASCPQDDATSPLLHAAPRVACATVAAGLGSPPPPCGGAAGFTAYPR